MSEEFDRFLGWWCKMDVHGSYSEELVGGNSWSGFGYGRFWNYIVLNSGIRDVVSGVARNMRAYFVVRKWEHELLVHFNSSNLRCEALPYATKEILYICFRYFLDWRASLCREMEGGHFTMSWLCTWKHEGILSSDGFYDLKPDLSIFRPSRKLLQCGIQSSKVRLDRLCC